MVRWNVCMWNYVSTGNERDKWGQMRTNRDKSGQIGTRRDNAGQMRTNRDKSGQIGTNRDKSGQIGTRELRALKNSIFRIGRSTLWMRTHFIELSSVGFCRLSTRNNTNQYIPGSRSYISWQRQQSTRVTTTINKDRVTYGWWRYRQEWNNKSNNNNNRHNKWDERIHEATTTNYKSNNNNTNNNNEICVYRIV